MNKILKSVSISMVVLLSVTFMTSPVLYARQSGITAPVLDAPSLTIEVPDDMPSPFENLGDKYGDSKDDLKEQGWGENNYKDGLANKLTPPKGFGTETGQDVFMGTYGTSVMNENWADFGHSAYTEEKFTAQKQLVSTSYVNYFGSGPSYANADTILAGKETKPNLTGPVANPNSTQWGKDIAGDTADLEGKIKEGLSDENKQTVPKDVFEIATKTDAGRVLSLAGIVGTLGAAGGAILFGAKLGGGLGTVAGPLGTVVGGFLGAGAGALLGLGINNLS